MITLDLFEQDPNFRKPVEYENTKQFGTVNLANFIKAYQNNQPVQFDFPGGKSYKLTAQWVDLLGDYYNHLETQNDKAQLVYYVLTDYNKTIRLLNDLAQSKLFEKKSEQSSDSQDFKSTKLSRIKRQARAKYPAAANDIEAMAADFVDSQESDQKEFGRIKAINQKQDELLKQLAAINQTQDQEIDGLERDETELVNNIKQIRSANAELAKKLIAMGRRKQSKSDAKSNEPKNTDAEISTPDSLSQTVITPSQPPAAPTTKTTTKRKRRSKSEIESEKASKAAMAAMTKMAGGKKITPVEPELPVTPTVGEPAIVPQAIPKTIDLFPGVTDINKTVEPKLANGDVTNADNVVYDMFPEKLQKQAAESKIAEELPAKAKYKLQQWKNQQNQPQQEPAVTTAPAEPQPVPARLSDLQAQHQKIEALTNIKGKIEDTKEKYTKTGRQLPRGLSADLEDYFTMADVDQHFDEMLAKYQKQLTALTQYINMQKILKKKVTHEMKVHELEEGKSEVWTVHFTDGTAVRVRVPDETNPANVRKHYANKGKTVAKFDYGYGVEPEGGSGPEAHEPGSGRATSARTGDPLPEDTKSEFKVAALAKIKKALANPKLDPSVRKDYEARLKKIQDLEEAKWKKETPWVKSTGKDPRGEVTHMSDVARKETERRDREDSPMGQLFKDFEKVFGKKPPVKEGDVVNINRGGYNQFRDKNDFLDKRDYVQQQLLDPRQRDNHAELKQRLQDINYAGRKLGYIK